MIKSFFYIIIALASVFYALPILPLQGKNAAAMLFSLVWILFALIVIGAHLSILIEKDMQKRINSLNNERYWIWKKEQSILKAQTKSYKKMK